MNRKKKTPTELVTCEFCPQTFSYNQMYYKHVNASHQEEAASEASSWITCPECSMIFPTKYALSRHSSKAHSTVTTRFQCKFCEKALDKRRELTAHCNKKHRELLKDAWFLCEPCDTYFVSDHVLKCHNAMAHPTKPHGKEFQCEFCPAVLSSLKTYSIHSNSMHKEEISKQWLQCPHCVSETYFQSQTSLRVHSSRAHRNLTEESKKEKSFILCSLCPRKFSATWIFLKHANQEHKDQISCQWLRCQLCPDNFYVPTKLFMIRHQKKFHKTSERFDTAPCEFCGKYILRSFRIKHANTLHRTEALMASWLSCHLCEKVFPHESAKRSHLRTSHMISDHPAKRKRTNKVQPYEIICQWCGQVFKQQTRGKTFYNHANIFHRDEISQIWLSCQVCSKFYPDASLLNRHMLSHPDSKPTKVLPYTCVFCSRQFSTEDQVFRHCNYLHFELVSQNWIVCSLCKKYFPSSHDLEGHTKTCATKRHRNYLRCDYCPSKFRKAVLRSNHVKRKHPDKVDPNDETSLKVATDENISEPIPEVIVAVPPRLGCSLCGEKFVIGSDLIDHCNARHKTAIEDYWISCDLCPIFLPNENNFEDHQSISHSNTGKCHDCIVCHKKLTTEHDLILHASYCHSSQLKQDGWLPCSTCQLLFPDENTKGTHKHDDYDLSISCVCCDMKFPDENRLSSHALQFHADDVNANWNFCCLCQMYLIPSRLNMSAHNLEIHGIRTCTLCLKVFSVDKLHVDHVRMRHNADVASKWSHCKICSMFLPKCDIFTHAKVCLKAAKSSTELSKLNGYTRLSTFDVKQSTSRKKDSTLIDIRVKLNRNFSRDCHRCNQCQRFFVSRKSYRRHLRLESHTES